MCDRLLHSYRINSKSKVLLHLFGNYTITKEQIFYECNVALKYFTVIPAALLFTVTTNLSEFAASINRLGVNYKNGYSISLALQYIPDIQRDFNEIKQSQEARGIDMSKDVSLPTRVKSMGAILFPLIFSSMERYCEFILFFEIPINNNRYYNNGLLINFREE